jgi:succinylarginine dihydrolase
MASREYNFDGLVGPTHNYGGLSVGNVASTSHGGEVSHPREAALQVLEKMRFVYGLGVGQAVLPPQPRPSLRTLRALGFTGSDEVLLARVTRESEHLLRLCSSAAAMWTANAATLCPSEDADDGRLHLTVANLQQMFHRAIEAPTTHEVLKSIFADVRHFAVHAPLPGGGQFADEGAANHTRLWVKGAPAVHLFGWGRAAYGDKEGDGPRKFPARQTLEASQAVSRLNRVPPAQRLFWRQDPAGIDGGAFHTDVLAVGNDGLLLLHERAFVDPQGLLKTLGASLGDTFRYVLATEQELPVSDAVAAYPFNSQLLTLPSGKMAIVAPKEAEQNPRAKAYLDRVVAENNPLEAVHYLDVRQSMNNGGGPACLRLRVRLKDEERNEIKARVFYDAALHDDLAAWIKRHYRDRLTPQDLSDPKLSREVMTALDELTQLLKLGSVYDFQQN